MREVPSFTAATVVISKHLHQSMVKATNRFKVEHEQLKNSMLNGFTCRIKGTNEVP
jgi:hypothetical protein